MLTDAKYDVVSLGELLIDFTQNGKSAQGNPLFEANPGGAPANVLAMLRRLGRSCAFLGKVGADGFGALLSDTLRAEGIGIRGLRRDSEAHTTLAIVHTADNGERDFSFYRRPGADVNLSADELDCEALCSCRIFHFGSLSLTDEPVRTATRQAVSKARESGALISFDPNLRPPLWQSEDAAREQIAWGLRQCDVLKIADNELAFMTGETGLGRGAAALRARFPNLKLLNVTAGAQGSCSFYRELRAYEPACKLGGVIETTGAGDTFCACVLHFLLSHDVDVLTDANLHEMLRFANAAAYLVTTRRGALRSMPERAEIDAVLQKM
ncbi:MAG: carbohydrate kinase [Oscillospiraceae bacterium]|nr:carbohydrate kinase [Oscillospiraceae bacterium]